MMHAQLHAPAYTVEMMREHSDIPVLSPKRSGNRCMYTYFYKNNVETIEWARILTQIIRAQLDVPAKTIEMMRVHSDTSVLSPK